MPDRQNPAKYDMEAMKAVKHELERSGVRIISVRELNKKERVVYDNLRQE